MTFLFFSPFFLQVDLKGVNIIKVKGFGWIILEKPAFQGKLF